MDAGSGPFAWSVFAHHQDRLWVYADWAVVGIVIDELRALLQDMESPGCPLGRGCSGFPPCLPVFSIAPVGVVGDSAAW